TGMATAIIELIDLGNSVKDIAAFTNQDSSEIRRLRTLASPPRTHVGVSGGARRVHQLPR
ncbi:MAG TPA: hypothetical protein VFX16_08505, partial [Pseudonocardiaceae bacterium]|nr:hypothetical protein [Pseudonocardiaceae bacterium]